MLVFYNKLNNNTITFSDIDNWLHFIKCNTVMDAPIAKSKAWKKFIEYYPNSKVIITIKDPKKRFKSIQKILKNVLLTWWFSNVVCNQYIIYQLYYVRHVWIKTYFEETYNIPINKLLNDESEQLFVETDAQTLDDIKNSVTNKENLLLFDVNDGWEPLCKFLHVDIPKDIPFPHENKGPTMTQKMIKKFANVIEAQLKNDYFVTLLTIVTILVCIFIAVYMK